LFDEVTRAVSGKFNGKKIKNKNMFIEEMDIHQEKSIQTLTNIGEKTNYVPYI
jgi:hypothetical protein